MHVSLEHFNQMMEAGHGQHFHTGALEAFGIKLEARCRLMADSKPVPKALYSAALLLTQPQQRLPYSVKLACSQSCLSRECARMGPSRGLDVRQEVFSFNWLDQQSQAIHKLELFVGELMAVHHNLQACHAHFCAADARQCRVASLTVLFGFANSLY